MRALLWNLAPCFLLLPSFVEGLGIRYGDIDEPTSNSEEETSAGWTRNCASAAKQRIQRFTDEPEDEDIASMHDEMLSGHPWIETPPAPFETLSRKPKLVLMMFVDHSVFNAELWSAWMRQAREQGHDFRLVIHSKSNFTTPEFAEYVLPETAYTNPCNLWVAQMLVFNRTMQDPAITHFAMVSENSIPTQPLGKIYEEIELDPRSRFCADEVFERVPGFIQSRAESWWLLRRDDAEVFFNNTQHMHSKFARSCIDENAWYGPLKLREKKWGAEAAVKNECFMWTDWKLTKHPCKQWADHASLCDCPHLRNLSHTRASGQHPATFNEVDAVAMQEMIKGPFWFARKFRNGALSPEALSVAVEAWKEE